LVAALATVQVTAFVGQEVVERLVSRVPLGTLGHDHLLAIGIGVQLVVALVGAAGLWWLARLSARIVETVRGARMQRPRPALASATPSAADLPRAGVVRSPRSVRGPPSA
jgi:hypothetical protein